jgi:hypothetical protein
VNGGATSMEPLRVFRDRFYADLLILADGPTRCSSFATRS